MHKPSLRVFRLMLVALIITYGLAQYHQWHWGVLSQEAAQYQQIAEAVLNGLSLGAALQKVTWLAGNLSGFVGVGLLFFRYRSGLPMLVVSAPLLGAAPLISAPEPAYPFLGRPTETLAWCAVSAIWASVVTYAALGGPTLLSAGRATRSDEMAAPAGTAE